MRPMKPVYAVALLAALALPVFADDVLRTPVPDARPLMLGALQATDGQAHGVLTGEMADAITALRGHLADPHRCDDREALRPTGLQPAEGHLLARRRPPARSDDSAATDDGLRHQLPPRRPAATIPEVEPI